MPRLSRLIGLSIGVALTGFVGGCEALQPGGALLYVFSTHHATPEDGAFPHRGDDEQPRVFTNDEGWTVTLVESYVTIEQITLVSCGGTQHPLSMFWGPCPEDLRVEDLQTLTVAGRKVSPGDYCELIVDYGQYKMPEIDPSADDTRHRVPSNEDVDGTTVYLRGGASFGTSGEDPLEFEFRGTESQTVTLDLSTIQDGSPLHVDHTEDFPVELTISKTYDRFFQGIDFESFDQDDVEDELDAVLEEDTRVQVGQSVLIDDESEN